MASRLTTFIVVLIVAGTLIAGLIVGAQRDDMDGPVDLIITNGRVYTGSATSFAEAVAVRGNKILRVGSNREIKRMGRRQTVAIDAHGATVLPGFNDAHVQLLEGGLSLEDADLSGAATLEEIGARVRDFIDRHPDRTWVVGRGWSRDGYNGVATRQQLDTILSDRPVYLIADDGAGGWANTRALRAADITGRTVIPGKGAIDRDARTGEPTGRLEGAAHAMMLGAMPLPSPADREAAVRAAIREAHRLGVTSVHDFGRSAARFATYDALRASGELPLRIYAAMPVDRQATATEIAQLGAVRQQYPDDPVFKAGPASIDVDAGEPIEEGPAGSGEERAPSSSESSGLGHLVAALDRGGWQVELHAGGAAAVRASLDAIERAAMQSMPRAGERRHLIDGIRALDPADAARFATSRVIASLQPFEAAAVPSSLVLFGNAGAADRTESAWPLHSLEQARARVVFGSNWPSATLDPRFGLDAVTTGSASRDEAAGEKTDRASLAAAIDAYTASPAWASFDEQRKGALAPDMLADIVILSSDIFAPGARVLDTVVDTTIFDGRIVYSRSAPELTE